MFLEGKKHAGEHVVKARPVGTGQGDGGALNSPESWCSLCKQTEAAK